MSGNKRATFSRSRSRLTPGERGVFFFRSYKEFTSSSFVRSIAPKHHCGKIVFGIGPTDYPCKCRSLTGKSCQVPFSSLKQMREGVVHVHHIFRGRERGKSMSDEIMDDEQKIEYLTDLLANKNYAKLIYELRHDHEVDVALMETLPTMRRRLSFGCCRKR